jgi:hypothetical protein
LQDTSEDYTGQVTQGSGHQNQQAGGGQYQGAEQHRGAGRHYVAEPVQWGSEGIKPERPRGRDPALNQSKCV